MFCLGVMAWWSGCSVSVWWHGGQGVLSRCGGMVVTVFCLGVMAWWSGCSVSV